MIKLIHLLKEIVNNPKAIIMAGSAGSGKTFFYNKIKDFIKEWKYFNPDKFDRNKDFYEPFDGSGLRTWWD